MLMNSTAFGGQIFLMNRPLGPNLAPYLCKSNVTELGVPKHLMILLIEGVGNIFCLSHNSMQSVPIRHLLSN